MRFPALALPCLLAACASPPKAPPPRPLPPPPAAPAGTEAIMGRDPEALLVMLGTAQMDRREGPARQLQWGRGGCVLDVWFYPRGAVLAATHAAARGADGSALAAGECFRRLRATEAGRAAPAPTTQPPPPPATRRKPAARAR